MEYLFFCFAILNSTRNTKPYFVWWMRKLIPIKASVNVIRSWAASLVRHKNLSGDFPLFVVHCCSGEQNICTLYFVHM